MTYEREPFEKFLAGEPDGLDEADWFQDWLSTVRDATSAGRRFERVRVVDRPMSDYSRWTYQGAGLNNAAGEDIRYLDRSRAQDAGLPDHDYWLFDSRKLLRMHFDKGDHLLSAEIIEDPAEVVRHCYWRDVAWHHAVKRDDFAIEEQLDHA